MCCEHAQCRLLAALTLLAHQQATQAWDAFLAAVGCPMTFSQFQAVTEQKALLVPQRCEAGTSHSVDLQSEPCASSWLPPQASLR